MRMLTVTSTATVDCLAFSPDRTRLAAGCKKANVRLWDVVTGKQPGNLKGTRDARFVGFVGGPDVLVTWSSYNTPAVRWDLRSWAHQPLGPAPRYCWDTALSPDGTRLLRVEDRIVCRSLADGSTLWEADWVRESQVNPQARYDGGGSRVFLVSHRVAVLDAATGAELAGFDLSFGKYGPNVCTAAVSPDGRWVAVRGSSGLQVYETADGRLVFRDLSSAFGYGYTLAFTPDGSRLAASPFGGAPRVEYWQTGTWRILPSFDPGIGPVQALAFAPDGTLAAAGGFNGQVALWDLE
jgi:WD40 repeat protein